MHVSSTYSYFVRTAIVLYFINFASSYDKQSLNVTNEEKFGLSANRKDFLNPSHPLTDKSLRSLSSYEVRPTSTKNDTSEGEIGTKKLNAIEKARKKELQKLILAETSKNYSNRTGLIKRKKRCLITMMALGGIASMASWLLTPSKPRNRRPKPSWRPTTTHRPYYPPPTTTRRPYYPPPTTTRRPYYPPPTTTRRPYYPPPTTTRRPYYPPPTTTRRPYYPPSTTTRRPYYPPSTTTRRPYYPPSTTTRRPYYPPSTTTRRPRPRPTTTRPPPPPSTTTTTTTTSTTRPPTTITIAPAISPSPTIVSTPIVVPDEPADVDTDIETGNETPNQGYGVGGLKQLEKWFSPWGSLVRYGYPKYNISTAVYITNTVKKITPTGLVVLQFVHPLTKRLIEVPLSGGDEYINPRTHKVYIIFVDTSGKTLLILKGSRKLYPEQFPIGDNIGNNTNINLNNNTNIIHYRTKWGSVVVAGIPHYNISTATIIRDTKKMINSKGIAILQFVHPFTKKIIQVPVNGGDEFVNRKTREVFIIFVDIQGRTILIFKGIDRSLPTQKKIESITESAKIAQNQVRDLGSNSGTLVVNGVPKYDIDNAIIVTLTKKEETANGTLILQCSHPITLQPIQVPFDKGDEYVNPQTKEIFVIFVDIQGRTLLLFKKKPQAEDELRSGSIVVNGFPKFNITNALIIMEITKKIRPDGTLIFEFLHPITKVKIQVPQDGSEEYVDPKTNEIFIIFVDSQGQTLLISKEKRSSIDKSQQGSIVEEEVPKPNIENALIILETIQKIRSDGTLVLEFLHPVTKVKIQVPQDGGEEYVDPKTNQIFIIFVDSQGRTLLILKNTSSSLLKPTQPIESNNQIDKNINVNKNKNINKIGYSERQSWGTMVVGGNPAYDIPKAIYVPKTWIKIENQTLYLEFKHPVTHEVIRVPAKGGDTYIDPTTKKIFIIIVDTQGRTILVPKQSDSPVDSSDEFRNMKQKPNWGTIVVNGVPKYDIISAIIVKNAKYKIINGKLIIEFEHPINRQIIQIPPNDGDEYVDPKTNQVFIIFVDIQGRTILILKGSQSFRDTQRPNDNVDNDVISNEKLYDENNWGSIVVNGVPKYDISTATIVTKVEQKIGNNGIPMLEFRHPMIREIIQVPLDGGDEYVNPETKQVFIIFVDIQGRTILILKGIDPSVSTDSSSGGRKIDNTFGSVVIAGVPKYDISEALYVMKTVKKIGINGISVVEFEHPITLQTIQVPLNGGDEYVKPTTREIFIIFVDLQGRTLLIFKDFESSLSDANGYESHENINKNTNINRNTNINKNMIVSARLLDDYTEFDE